MQISLAVLLQAISDDDCPRVKSHLQSDPVIAASRVETSRLYKSPFTHWLYAGDTALHLAAAGHRVEIARILLRAGADANAVGTHRHARPLHYAADGSVGSASYDPKRQVRMINCLLAAGAEINAQDKNGATPLHRAVRTRCAAAVACLLQAGADATARNKPGATPFHLAVQNTGRGGSGTDPARAAQHQIIQLMLKHNISVKLKDARGKSVLDWAREERVRSLLT